MPPTPEVDIVQAVKCRDWAMPRVRYTGEGFYGYMIRRMDGSIENYCTAHVAELAIWVKAPAVSEPKQHRPAK